MPARSTFRRWLRRSRAALRDNALALAALLVGFASAGLFSGTFQAQVPIRAATRPSLRRIPGIRVDLEINLPDGETTRTSRYLALDRTNPESVDIERRLIELWHQTSDAGWLEVRAQAAAIGNLPAFSAVATEGGRTLWRLPLATGLATLRVRMTREYLPS